MATSHAPVTGGDGAGSTAAMTTTETFAGFYVLRIDNFAGTKDLGVGEKIVSSTFRVAGHSWRIECYPCGDVEDSTG
ncbi:hypothetical protein PR202_ga22527 [Eleusine coracana subsp. coracana]|uniref:MATH domain-containing protein n=1 Tax=Eleusine coracana subsp. coracana TaxID=191504 RepID=A0AAV5D460_ELECO|nr:hypothetical protein PR202_ga22527 [Eleusine coracana subsp. coracana]